MMRFLLFLFTGLLLGGCTTADGQERSYIQSDRNLYYQQSVVHPLGQEPNATPYGTPANAGTSSDYDSWIRPDAISRYPGLN
ncbi:hypothetical protein [Brevibacillus sp. 1238]|uniref:hypothetical protein n=1 Tax=Brevibacillus sp. 1238 TaxID=2940565 RepID=UPI002474F697|nr:hypothetical protein [Brevibacillus sp. 1238]MDH6352245.1 hypothetical protein [Brevibacillus sp. 1238]